MAALSEIEKLEARWAENPDGRYFAPLADAYRKAGRVDDAIMVVEQGLAKHPDYLSAHIVLGRCHLEKKDDAAASASFERVLGLDTENIIALKSLAEIAERQGRPNDARQWLSRLLVVDAMNVEAAEDLARLGGPLESAAEVAAEPAADTGPSISFADLAPEPAAPEPAPLPEPEVDPALLRMANQRTLHVERLAPLVPPTVPTRALDLEPPPRPSPQEAATERMPALELEPTSFEPPATAHAGLADVERAEEFHAPRVRPSEQLAPAIDFLSVTEPPARAKASEPVAEEPAAVALPVESEEPAASPEPELVLDRAPSAGDLPLIMPEDVTPAEELRRPSSKQVQMVSPEPAAADEAPADPMLTETVGDLYLKQGFKDQAADVYRRLLAARPDDLGLKAKLAALASPAEALSAAAQGAEAVGSWLRRIARASLPSRRPAPDPGEGSPMEQAFAAVEPEPPPRLPITPSPASAPAGEPARPATDAFTLDRIFGGARPTPSPAESAAPAAPAGPSSFDEFFGAPKPDTAAPQRPSGGAPSEEDLSAFTSWLHGLKR